MARRILQLYTVRLVSNAIVAEMLANCPKWIQ